MSPCDAWSRAAVVAMLLGTSCTGADAERPAGAIATEQHDTGVIDGDGTSEIDRDAYTLVDDGVLTVCTDVPILPFTFQDPDTPTGYGGFDLDLVAAVAAGLGLDVAVEEVTFEAITTGVALSEGRCDIAAAALTISAEWERQLDFTVPYFEVKQSLVVKEGAPPVELTGAAGTSIGVQSGTPAQDFLEREAPAGAEVVTFANTTDLLAALEMGGIDAVALSLPTGSAWVAADMGVSVVETFVTDDGYGIATGAGRDDGLLRVIDAELVALREDGTRDRLLAEYFVFPEAVAPGTD